MECAEEASVTKVTKETFFDIQKKLPGQEKSGIFKSCQKSIPMKNSNTTGLKSHLRSCNPQGYRQLYPTEKKNVENGQKTIDDFTSVSIQVLLYTENRSYSKFSQKLNKT